MRAVMFVSMLLALVARARELPLDAVEEQSIRSEITDREKLDVCDCRPASGDPNGLSCDAEGYVIAGFERHGQWVVGGDPVPLNRAICCRPCRKGDKSQDDVVVSLGCHASSDPGSSFRCEHPNDDDIVTSFAVGFTSASRVFAPGEPAYYPSDAVECCSPSLAHPSGEFTVLEPCECIKSDTGVSCGGDEDGRVLVGFGQERIAPSGHYVPVGVADCCRMCVAGDSRMDCAALDHCSGRGACILGSCACIDGWSGATCKVREAGGGDIPAWAIAVIVVGSCLLGVLAIGSLAYMCELFIEAREARQREAEESDDEDAPTRPLLIQLDREDDGSVGSQDTTDEDEDQGDTEIAGRIAAAERDLNAGADELAEGGTAVCEQESRDDANSEGKDDRHPRGQPGGVRDEACSASATNDDHGRPEVSLDDDEDIDQIKERLKRGHGPLAGVLCGVCLDRPVQVCVIPCGHVCMCRRCSRRVRRCPVCRSIVARRQKLFV